MDLPQNTNRLTYFRLSKRTHYSLWGCARTYRRKTKKCGKGEMEGLEEGNGADRENKEYQRYKTQSR